MRYSFALAALAGSALAAPSYGTGYGQQQEEVKNVHVVVETVVKTVYVTEGYEAPAATSVVYEAPAAPTTTVVYEEPKPSKPAEPVYEAPAPVQPTPTPTPTPEAPAPAPPAQGGYMGVVDTWRSKMGLSKLECDSTLEGNAQKVVEKGNGVMRHELFPGTYGQVLAPGGEGDEAFEKVFVGGWLCELPKTKGLDGVCDKMSQGWSYEGQTGHAEILTNPGYKKIGCALSKGIWCCDLA